MAARVRGPGKDAARAEVRVRVVDRVGAKVVDPENRVSAGAAPAPGSVLSQAALRDYPEWEPKTVRLIRFLLMMGTLQAW